MMDENIKNGAMNFNNPGLSDIFRIFFKTLQSMINSVLVVLLLLVVVLGSCQSNKKKSEPTAVERNLFEEQGYSVTDVNQHIAETFDQLFFGNDSVQAIYHLAGSNENGQLAFIIDSNNEDITGEGVAKAMMICVQLDKKHEFDALWNWAYSKMYVIDSDHPNHGYFRWSVLTDGTPQAETPSPIAEEYFVTSLFFASHRWGDGRGIFEYGNYANTILSEMRHHPVVTGSTLFGERQLGPMIDEGSKLIRFNPDGSDDPYVSVGAVTPAFYELWAEWGPEEDRSFWSEAASAAREFLRNHCHPKTGLPTDIANIDGTPRAVEWNPLTGHFGEDSWQVLANIGVDYSWWKKDKVQKDIANRILTFLGDFGVDQFGSSFTQNGKVLKASGRAGLLATAAVITIASDISITDDFVKEFWNQQLPIAPEYRSSDGILMMLGLLQCSGEYRIW